MLIWGTVWMAGQPPESSDNSALRGHPQGGGGAGHGGLHPSLLYPPCVAPDTAVTGIRLCHLPTAGLMASRTAPQAQYRLGSPPLLGPSRDLLMGVSSRICSQITHGVPSQGHSRYPLTGPLKRVQLMGLFTESLHRCPHSLRVSSRGPVCSRGLFMGSPHVCPHRVAYRVHSWGPTLPWILKSCIPTMGPTRSFLLG